MNVALVASVLLLAHVSAVAEPKQASAPEASNKSVKAAKGVVDSGAVERKESKRDLATDALDAANTSFDRVVDKAERALNKVKSFAEGVKLACKNETRVQEVARDIEEKVQHEVEAKNLTLEEQAKLLKYRYYSSRREQKKLGRALEKEAREAAHDVKEAGSELKRAASKAKVAEREYERDNMNAEKRSEELSHEAEKAGESSEVDAEHLFDRVEHSIEKSARLLQKRAQVEAQKDAEEKAATKKASKAEAEKEVAAKKKAGSDEAEAVKKVESHSRHNTSEQLLEMPAAAAALLAQEAHPASRAVDDAKERYQRALDAAERAISEAGSFAKDFKHSESNKTRVQALTARLKSAAKEQAETKNLSLEKRADVLKEAFYIDRRAHLDASRVLERSARALAGEVKKTGLELKAALHEAGGSEHEVERAEERAERDSERIEERAERARESAQDDIEDLYQKAEERVEEAVDQLRHEAAVQAAREAKEAKKAKEAREAKEAEEAKKAEEAKEVKAAKAAEAEGAAKSAQSAGRRRPSRASFLALPAGAAGGERTFDALSCAALAAVALLAAMSTRPCARRTVRMDVPALG